MQKLTYHVEFQELKEGEKPGAWGLAPSEFNASAQSLRITGLKPLTSYAVRVVPENPYGKGQSSEVLKLLTKGNCFC